jgi:hypothetical protein
MTPGERLRGEVRAWPSQEHRGSLAASLRDLARARAALALSEPPDPLVSGPLGSRSSP